MSGPRRVRFALLSTIAALSLLVTSRGGVGARAATTSSGSGTSRASDTLSCDPVAPFDAGSISTPTIIDNTWLPLVPGTQLTLEGSAAAAPHRVVFTSPT